MTAWTACVVAVRRRRRRTDRVGVGDDGVHLVRGGVHALVGWDELVALGFTYDQRNWTLELYPADQDLSRLHRHHPVLAGLDRLDGPTPRRALPPVRLLVWIPRGAVGQPALDRVLSTGLPGHYLPPAPRTGTVLPPGSYLPVGDLDG